MIEYNRETYASCIPEIMKLFPEHAKEVYVNQAQPKIDDSVYRDLESNGLLVLITARRDGVLVGYSTSILARDRHSNDLQAYVDSYYLIPSERKGWAGIKLLRVIEDTLRDIGVAEVTTGAKVHLDTAKLFEYHKYQQVEILYSKKL